MCVSDKIENIVNKVHAIFTAMISVLNCVRDFLHALKTLGLIGNGRYDNYMTVPVSSPSPSPSPDVEAGLSPDQEAGLSPYTPI